MPQFVGDVFGLNSVYEKQVSNVENKNFASWSEGGIYGYFGGGYTIPGSTRFNTILRLDFSSETISTPGKNLPSAVTKLASVISSSYGYFGGGEIGAVSFLNTITRIDFSSETISNPNKNLPVVGGYSTAISNTSYGYFVGAQLPSGLNTITRLDFSNETISNPNKNLPGTRGAAGTTASGSYGYFGGGITTVGGTYLNTITRIDFSNENVSDPGKNLPGSRAFSATVTGGQSVLRGNKSFGYFGGGYVASPAVFTSQVLRIDFSNDVLSAPVNLVDFVDSVGATASNFFGYFAGGRGPGPGNTSIIGRLDFSNETVRRIQDLPTERYAPSGLSSSSYAYFGGGGPVSTNTITRLDFFTESLNNTSTLPTASYGISSASNNLYGYFVGGFTTVYISNVTRLDFSNEIRSFPGNGILPTRGFFAGLSNNFYGYFAGGAGTQALNTITRLDFSNEILSDPGGALSTNRFSTFGASSSFYGYFAGGFPPFTNSISRIDFSTEVVSATTNLPAGTSGAGGISNSN